MREIITLIATWGAAQHHRGRGVTWHRVTRISDPEHGHMVDVEPDWQLRIMARRDVWDRTVEAGLIRQIGSRWFLTEAGRAAVQAGE